MVESASGGSTSTIAEECLCSATLVLGMRSSLSTVLSIFTTLGRERGKSLSEETWTILLKLLMGITDALVTAVEEDTPTQMLAPQLMKVIEHRN